MATNERETQDEQDLEHGGDEGKMVTTLRIPRALLRRIDERAKFLGVSRTAYMLMAVAKAAESGL